jgi:hypothetical protein
LEKALDHGGLVQTGFKPLGGAGRFRLYGVFLHEIYMQGNLWLKRLSRWA